MKFLQYKNAIENSNIVSKTDIDGVITFVNDEFCKISGFSREELVGKNHNIVRHPDVPSEKFELLWNTIKSKKTYKATVKNRAKNGATFYLNTTVTPILDDDGNIEEYIAIRYDVTKEIELQKMLFLHSRLASLGQMIANIAHQWRQPLTELNLALFNIKKSFASEKNNETDELFLEPKNLINSMSKTIDDFTNFFSPNKSKQKFFIEESVKESMQILKESLRKERINITFLNQKIKSFGIKNELTQVLINIIQNSKDAFVQNNIIDRKIEIKISKSIDKNSYVDITICDNAGGISEDILEKIFEPYFTTKHSSVGTGLGLFMSRMIIEKSLDGLIQAKNYSDGVEIKISIPMECEDEKL